MSIGAELNQTLAAVRRGDIIRVHPSGTAGHEAAALRGSDGLTIETESGALTLPNDVIGRFIDPLVRDAERRNRMLAFWPGQAFRVVVTAARKGCTIRDVRRLASGVSQEDWMWALQMGAWNGNQEVLLLALEHVVDAASTPVPGGFVNPYTPPELRRMPRSDEALYDAMKYCILTDNVDGFQELRSRFPETFARFPHGAPRGLAMQAKALAVQQLLRDEPVDESWPRRDAFYGSVTFVEVSEITVSDSSYGPHRISHYGLPIQEEMFFGPRQTHTRETLAGRTFRVVDWVWHPNTYFFQLEGGICFSCSGPPTEFRTRTSLELEARVEVVPTEPLDEARAALAAKNVTDFEYTVDAKLVFTFGP